MPDGEGRGDPFYVELMKLLTEEMKAPALPGPDTEALWASLVDGER